MFSAKFTDNAQLSQMYTNDMQLFPPRVKTGEYQVAWSVCTIQLCHAELVRNFWPHGSSQEGLEAIERTIKYCFSVICTPTDRPIPTSFSGHVRCWTGSPHRFLKSSFGHVRCWTGSPHVLCYLMDNG